MVVVVGAGGGGADTDSFLAVSLATVSMVAVYVCERRSECKLGVGAMAMMMRLIHPSMNGIERYCK